MPSQIGQHICTGKPTEARPFQWTAVPPWACKYNYTCLAQAQYFSDRAASDADSTDALLRRTDLRILLLIILAILCSKRASFSSFIKPTIIMQAAIISITVNANPIFPSDEHLFVMFILLSFFPFVNTFFKKTFLCLPLTGSKKHPFDHNGSCISLFCIGPAPFF